MVARIVVEFESSQTALFSQRFEGDKITEGQFEIIGRECCAIAQMLRSARLAEQLHIGKVQVVGPQPGVSTPGVVPAAMPIEETLYRVPAGQNEAAFSVTENGQIVNGRVFKRSDGVEQSAIAASGRAMRVKFE